MLATLNIPPLLLCGRPDLNTVLLMMKNKHLLEKVPSKDKLAHHDQTRLDFTMMLIEHGIFNAQLMSPSRATIQGASRLMSNEEAEAKIKQILISSATTDEERKKT